MSSSNSSMQSEVMSLEYATLKVPYELLNRKFRMAQKTIDREIAHTSKELENMEQLFNRQNEPIVNQEVLVMANNVIESLQQLILRASDALREELTMAETLKKRLNHLKGIFADDVGEEFVRQWKQQRVDRMLIDYFLRSGYYESAASLANSADIDYMANLSVFDQAAQVERSLQQHNVSVCLEWCHEHKSKLRRLRSNFELKVRQQEFIEYIKRGKRIEATRYAQKFLTTIDDGQWADMLHYMGSLAFPLDTKTQPYCDLFSEKRWEMLVQLFRQAAANMYQLNIQSAFSACVQAGLAALKTPHCYTTVLQQKLSDLVSMELDEQSRDGDGSDECSMEERSKRRPTGRLIRTNMCPVCIPDVSELARPLPYAHASHSRLICAHSGENMNEHNPPMMLPNGMVYSQNSLQAIMAANGGQIVCPRTQQVFSSHDCEKLYIM